MYKEMKMFNKVNYFFSIMLIFFLCCCSQEEKKKEEVNECKELTMLVEDCMGLHRGALNYLEDCGSLKLEEVEALDTCEEILEYTGLDSFKNE